MAYKQDARQHSFAQTCRVSPNLRRLDNQCLPREEFKQIIHKHAHLDGHEAARPGFSDFEAQRQRAIDAARGVDGALSRAASRCAEEYQSHASALKIKIRWLTD